MHENPDVAAAEVYYSRDLSGPPALCPACKRPVIDHNALERKQCHDAVNE